MLPVETAYLMDYMHDFTAPDTGHYPQLPAFDLILTIVTISAQSPVRPQTNWIRT